VVQAIDQIEDLLRRLGRAFAVLRLTTNSHFVTGGPCTITAVYELGEPFIQRVFDLVTFIDIIGGSTERGLWWNNPTDIWHL
jgi:hypothetical protein